MPWWVIVVVLVIVVVIVAAMANKKKSAPVVDPRGQRLFQAIQGATLTLPGWVEQASEGKRVWRHPSGCVLSLCAALDSWANCTDTELRNHARELAKTNEAGLIEVGRVMSRSGPAIGVLYKSLHMPAYGYTGVLLTPLPDGVLVWTVNAMEQGVTGMREATVTQELFNAGKLTIEDYERSWAQDPYDKNYHGVDRRVLRFLSDDEQYDSRFPDHPLTQVRRVLRELASGKAEPQVATEKARFGVAANVPLKHPEPQKPQWAPVEGLRPGPLQHESLTAEQMERVRRIHQALRETDDSTLEKWVNDFRHDLDPDSEIHVWETIAAAHIAYCAGKELTQAAKKEALGVLILRSTMSEQQFLAELRGGTHVKLKLLSPQDA